MTKKPAKEETSAGGVIYRLTRTGTPLYLLISDSYRNWGFPKGHVERGEEAEAAALREAAEETRLDSLQLRGKIDVIDWHFRFRGRLIHKHCHFYLMESASGHTSPQRAEGITECKWVPFEQAETLVSYANARDVLRRAHEMVAQRAAAV